MYHRIFEYQFDIAEVYLIKNLGRFIETPLITLLMSLTFLCIFHFYFNVLPHKIRNLRWDSMGNWHMVWSEIFHSFQKIHFSRHGMTKLDMHGTNVKRCRYFENTSLIFSWYYWHILLSLSINISYDPNGNLSGFQIKKTPTQFIHANPFYKQKHWHYSLFLQRQFT